MPKDNVVQFGNTNKDNITRPDRMEVINEAIKEYRRMAELPEDMELKDKEWILNEIVELSAEFKELVFNDPSQAATCAQFIMESELGEDTSHVEIVPCISKTGQFFKMVMVPKNEQRLYVRPTAQFEHTLLLTSAIEQVHKHLDIVDKNIDGMFPNKK